MVIWSLPNTCVPVPVPVVQSKSKDPKTWDSILHSQAKLKNDKAILRLYQEMEAAGVVAEQRSFPLVLKACARLGAVEMGRKIHSDIVTRENENNAQDIRVRTSLIDFYCKCGLPQEAKRVFEQTVDKDIVSWNAMICGCGCPHDTLALFYRMQNEKNNLIPTCVTLVALLLACGELMEFRLGQQIHCYSLRRGLLDMGPPHLPTALLTFYSRFEYFEYHSSSFSSLYLLTNNNTDTWNALISSYFNQGDASMALTLFIRMLLHGMHPTHVSLLVAIQCSPSLDVAKQIHQIAVKFNLSSHLFIATALIRIYAQHQHLDSSLVLLNTIPVTSRDVALWNAIMSCFKDCGNYQQVFTLFATMRSHGYREDSTTVAILLESAKGLRKEPGLHALVVKNRFVIDVPLGNALLTMYADLNSLDSAQRIFYEIKSPNLVSWNTMIMVMARVKLLSQMRSLFECMQHSSIKPNSFTMVAILTACKDEKYLNIGRSVHGYVVRHCLDLNLSLCTALTQMYLNCGDDTTARHLFYSYPNKDLVSWNALMTCFLDNNRHNDALLLFYEMLNEVEPNSVTVVNIISCCAHLASLPLSRCIHAYAVRREFTSGFSVDNALVTMYAKCGSIYSAEKVFKTLVRRDVVSWNAMIAAYGMHGRGKEALDAFSQMKKDGLTPTGVTFVSVLSACSHAGLVQEGLRHFYSITQDYSLTPQVVHYACVVDLLGRGGFLDEARKFISLMPIEPDASVWRALLSACRVYSQPELARTVFKKLVELDPMNVGNYILVSNIYAAGGLWKDVENLGTELKCKNLTKPIGKSWIVIRSQVHKFSAGDTSHPESNKIYSKLRLLMSLMKKNGYIPDRCWVLVEDIEDEEKDERLLSHSEKLAITYGLLNSKSATPIYVNKNLRVCGDCHTFSKYVSKFVGREIVLRDTTRFHHFVNGTCSCNDYW